MPVQMINYLENVLTIAAAGSVIGDATQISTKPPAMILVTGADATKGVKLPPAVSGKTVTIKNRDSENAVLKVWPYSATDQINAITAGSAISLAAKVCCTFHAVGSVWYTVPLLPS